MGLPWPAAAATDPLHWFNAPLEAMHLPPLKLCGTFPCDLASPAAMLHLSEDDVWGLVSSRRVHSIGCTAYGRLIFDGATIKPFETGVRSQATLEGNRADL